MGDANDAFMRSQNAAVQARTKAQNRATVLQLKLIGQSHPTGLTPNLLKLFEPRPPLEFKPPIEKPKCPPLTGIGQFVSGFAEPNDPEYAPPVPECETPAQKKARIHKARLEKGAIKAAEELEKYDPSKDPNMTGDPYKTLFVARLNYETSEHRLKREFEAYGPIKRIRLVSDKDRKPRGYAFIEYVHTRDMKTAYKQADGRKIDNRRVLVDVERGRTVANWRPRRLGGGLGSTRIGGEDANQKHSGRESQQPSAVARRSEEPRARRSEEPRERQLDREREKSRDRGRDRERERSRERSHDKGRDRDTREERHHRDRDRRERERGKDRGHERERERGRGRDRERDRVRDPREHDHERDRDRGREYDYEQGRERDRRRERDRDQERDYGRTNHDDDHSRSHAKGRDYESSHGQDWLAGADSQRIHNYNGFGYPDEAQPHDSNSLEQGEFKEYDQMEADGGKGQYPYDHPEAPDSHGRERGFGMEYDYQQKDRSIDQDVEQ